jgi:hypothetical protein
MNNHLSSQTNYYKRHATYGDGDPGPRLDFIFYLNVYLLMYKDLDVNSFQLLH